MSDEKADAILAVRVRELSRALQRVYPAPTPEEYADRFPLTRAILRAMTPKIAAGHVVKGPKR